MSSGPTVVVGAGVVGLAIARLSAMGGEEVWLLESEESMGTGASSRNSEVIHAGLYYPPDSLKAKTCVRGRDLVYRYAESKRIDYKQTGKIIVATDNSQLERLESIRENARKSGAGELTWLSADEVHKLEPNVHCVAGLWSPLSGIIDSHGLMTTLAGDFQQAGGMLIENTPVESITWKDSSLKLQTGGLEPYELECGKVILAAGLGSYKLAQTIVPFEVMPPEPKAFAKGSYFSLVDCPPPFQRLVYPLPETGGLGIHATVDLAGQVRFGPDVEWVDEIEYKPAKHKLDSFEQAIRKYWPELPEGALNPTYAGIRPKITGPGEPNADFLLLDET